MSPRSLFLIILIATAAAAQEIPVSDPAFVSASGTASTVASGDAFITVWSRPGLFAAVTGLGGTLRHDTVTISLTGEGKAIAGSPRGALVAWIDAGVAYTALVDRDGNVINRAPLAPMSSAYMIGAWNGSRLLLLVTTITEGVRGYLFDEDGRRIGEALAVGDNAGTKYISADRDGFLFLQRDLDQTIRARHIDNSGAMASWRIAATGVGMAGVAVYFDGTHHVIFWGYQGNLHRVLTDTFGAPVAPQVDVATSTAPPAQVVPSGDNSLLLLDDFSQSSLALVSPNGAMLQNVALSTRPSALAAIGNRALLVEGAPFATMRGRFIDTASSVAVGEPFAIAHQAAEQVLSQVASNGAIDFVAWYENGSLYGAQIDPVTRRRLDGSAILIDDHVPSVAPAVVAVGDVFFVAYLDVPTSTATNLELRRFAANGAFLDAAPMLVASTARTGRPRLATDGTNALLVWSEGISTIKGARIAPSGTILDPGGFLISESEDSTQQLLPDAAFNGENYLVAWQRGNFGLHTSPRGVSAVRVSPDGFVLDPPVDLQLFGEPHVAANAGTFGVAGPGAFFTEIAMATVDASGAAGRTVFLAQAPLVGAITNLTIAPSRDGFLVAFAYRGSYYPTPFELRAVYVAGGSAAEPFDPRPVRTATQYPALARTPHGLVLVYSRARGEDSLGGSLRAHLLLLDEPRRRAASR